MKKYYTFLFLFNFLTCLVAQPEINCDTVHTDPALSEYVLPYAPGKTYTVTQSNCFSNGGHNNTFAYDLNTKIGDTIVACRTGFVTFINDQYEDTDWVSGHENNVFIGHADGTRIRYTHLKKGGVLVNVNQQIDQGQPIGISGNSGNTGGFPHLHLSAFKDNTSFNRQNTIPINFCNTNDPFNDQNLLIGGQSYTAIEKSFTAVEETDIMDAIAVYPNPVNTVLNVDINNPDIEFATLQLYSTTGQLIYNINTEGGIQNTEIPVKELPKGVYLLMVKSEFELHTKKILVF